METKYCPDCGYDRPIDEFTFRNRKTGTRQPHCNDHRKQRARDHYQQNKRKIIECNTSRIRDNRQLVQQWKVAASCCICNESHFSCLDFHHVNPNEKKEIISILAARGLSLERIFEEVIKCVVLCSNCHRKFHANAIELTEEHIQFSKQQLEKSFALLV